MILSKTRDTIWDLALLNHVQVGYFRKNKGGVKIYTLFDLVTRIPTFIHITAAKVHDVNAKDEIPNEPYDFNILLRVVCRVLTNKTRIRDFSLSSGAIIYDVDDNIFVFKY